MNTGANDCDLLIRGVLALDPDLMWQPRRVDLAIVNGRIKEVAAAGAREWSARRVIAGADRLLAPGFVNAHTHSPLNILKGTGDRLSHPAFMWLNQADTAGRSPDEIRVSALLGVIEHLLSGTTSIIDHFPEQGFGVADVDVLAEAYAAAGIRAVIALRVFDAAYDDILPPGGLPADLAAVNPLTPPPARETLALVEDLVRRHDRHAAGRLRVFPAPSNPGRCSDALLADIHALACRYDLGVHTHLLETRAQAEIARSRTGKTMVGHLDALGVLDGRLSCAHTIWVDDEDIGLLASRGTIVVHNPESNLKIGAGFAPIARMLAAGVRIALGSDGASTNDNLAMHEAMRLAAILPRPIEPVRSRWPTAADVLAMATTGGAAAMREPLLGRLVPGAPADLVLYDLDDIAWVPLNDPARQLVFSETGRSVDTVIVAGRILVEGRRIVGFDPVPVLQEARDLLPRLRERNQVLYAAAAKVAALVP